ncbi:MAG: 3-oxoacyl-ACP reductase [Alphaproteobacteria bacterium]|jgi:3-oxoacyl-[acyl-carrier protein] reductase|nr:3-oxoacyl-ACP reductase [Alphaproteobacteria bacterium]
MDLGLNGKRALVTGGSRGIGRGIAEAFAAEGAKVIVASRNGDACAAAADAISSAHGTEVLGHACDMADLNSVDSLVGFTEEAFGGVDVLVNNTGGPPFGPISQVDSQTWRDSFEAMFVSVTRLTCHLLPGMRERGWGRILIVTSTGVVEPIPQLGISNSIRIGLTNWAKTLSVEVASDGVTVNTLMPGRIETDRLRHFYEVTANSQNIDLEEAKAVVAAPVPVGRVGTVEEFGALAAFLAGESAGYLTGTTTAIDGGLTQRAV